MAAIGTLVHEGGHVGVARVLGYGTTLHFGSMSWAGSPASADAQLERLHDLWITLGGPFCNMIIGTAGLVWLWRLARADVRRGRGVRWFAAIVALFWSRQLFNAIGYVWHLTQGEATRNGDEVKVAMYFGWPELSVLAATGAVGLAVCVAVVRLLPRVERRPFTIGGALGSLVGFGIWYGCVGPALLP